MKNKFNLQKKHLLIPIVLATILIFAARFINADDDQDDDDDDEIYSHQVHVQNSSKNQVESNISQQTSPTTSNSFYKTNHLKGVTDSPYKAECASCHMAYPPGLLPARSWTKMLNGLDKHFGENASLDDKSKNTLMEYLVTNSADHSTNRRSDRINQSIPLNAVPIRITETPYFIRKHDEINPTVWKRPQVKSQGNCIACHKGAEMGNFSEHEVSIPR